jgi:signal transduction histidine kinase
VRGPVPLSRLRLESRLGLPVWLDNVTARRRAAATQAFLGGIGAALGSSLDYLQTLSRAARAATPILGETCIIDACVDGGVREVTVADVDPELEDLARVMRQRYPPLYKSHPLEEVRRTGQSLLVPELDDLAISRMTVDDEHRRIIRRLGWRSMLFIPIVARDELLGVLTCCSRTRSFGNEDLALAIELAHRAALAIDNALLYRRAQQATRSRDEVLGIVSHDLRSALNTINLCAGALIDPVPAPADGIVAMATAIRHSAEWAQTLIKDLVDLSSLDAGRLRMRRAAVQPEDVVLRAHESFQPLVQQAGLALCVDVATGLPAVNADPERLLQVLFNLLSNAVRFTPTGGKISLRASMGETPRAVTFTVKDTGLGISAEDMPKVFTRFWQAEQGTHGGTGLGLAVAKGIVESHGGVIAVQSVPGSGTTFSFEMPVVES